MSDGISTIIDHESGEVVGRYERLKLFRLAPRVFAATVGTPRITDPAKELLEDAVGEVGSLEDLFSRVSSALESGWSAFESNHSEVLETESGKSAGAALLVGGVFSDSSFVGGVAIDRRGPQPPQFTTNPGATIVMGASPEMEADVQAAVTEIRAGLTSDSSDDEVQKISLRIFEAFATIVNRYSDEGAYVGCPSFFTLARSGRDSIQRTVPCTQRSAPAA